MTDFLRDHETQQGGREPGRGDEHLLKAGRVIGEVRRDTATEKKKQGGGKDGSGHVRAGKNTGTLLPYYQQEIRERKRE